jgi:polyisoprenoid-binding protein YceI
MKKRNLLVTVFCMGIFFTSCKSEKKEKTNETTDKEVVVEDNFNLAGEFIIDNEASYLNWIGSKPGGSHNGSVAVESGVMTFEDGNLVSGEFTIDMTSINVKDLDGNEKEDLENHLKGTVEGKEDHFFNVQKFPKSKFKITNVVVNNGKSKITGDLTIKGQTSEIIFESEVSAGANQEEIKLLSQPFKIDRTKWGIEFMSKSIFDDLKDKFIDDEIELSIMVKGKKKA